MNDLKTRFFDDVDKNCPLPEYPRPQLVREDWMCLNGECDYEITPAGDACPKDFSGKIILPFAIESQLSGVSARFSPTSAFGTERGSLSTAALIISAAFYISALSIGSARCLSTVSPSALIPAAIARSLLI